MAEYIDRAADRNALYDADAITMEGVRILNRFPAADVKPVVRGKWERRNWGFDYDCCSVCGYEHRYSGPFHYCPNCRAKMNGGAD